MEYIITFLAGWFIGRFVLKFTLVKNAIKAMNQNELDQFMRKREPEVMPALHTESVDGMVRLYDTSTSMYLCCGKTIEELAANLNTTCHINAANITHNDQKILVVDGKVA
jgi:hypothetical protein